MEFICTRTIPQKNDYLEHHGILGQKWGIRRFQNEDGSLTSAGKKRYADDGTKKSWGERRLNKEIDTLKGASRDLRSANRHKDADKLDDRIKKLNKKVQDKYYYTDSNGETKHLPSSKDLRKEHNARVKDNKEKGYIFTEEAAEVAGNYMLKKYGDRGVTEPAKANMAKAAAIVAAGAAVTYAIFKSAYGD